MMKQYFRKQDLVLVLFVFLIKGTLYACPYFLSYMHSGTLVELQTARSFFFF